MACAGPTFVRFSLHGQALRVSLALARTTSPKGPIAEARRLPFITYQEQEMLRSHRPHLGQHATLRLAGNLNTRECLLRVLGRIP